MLLFANCTRPLAAAATAVAAAAVWLCSHQVYPYSIFHIFFEQYLNTRKDAATLVGLPLLAVFVTAWIFTGGGGLGHA